jgi:Flp pilus assembly protein TadG
MPPLRHAMHGHCQRRGQTGQSIVEFALVVPIMLLILLAIADFGRLYASAVAVEAAGREAADFGAFESANWTSANAATTVGMMEQRACVAAAGSHLEGYATTDPVNDTTCTNPTFHCRLERGADSADCATSAGVVGTTDCSLATNEPPCTVHVWMEYEFRTLLGVPPAPQSLQIVRHSRFRVSDLTPASPAPSASP